MEPVLIDGSNNPLIKEYNRLKSSRRQRQKSGKIAVEGPNLVKEALKAGLNPEVVFFSHDYYKDAGNPIAPFLPAVVRKYILTPEMFKKIAQTETPQAVAAIFNFQTPGQAKQFKIVPNLAIILDRIQDPGNMGTLIRTAAAAGVDIIYYTDGSTDPYSPKVLRATAGAVFQVALEQASDPCRLIRDLKAGGVQVVAAAAEAKLIYWQVDLNKPLVLIVGNEAGGIAEELLAQADLVISIPLRGQVESLNAAVSSAVILYEIVRQRSQ